MTAPDPKSERLLFCATRRRSTALLDGDQLPGGDDPSVDEIVQSADSSAPAWAWTLAGGEPTLRPDLPALISALATAGAPRLGMVTDGLALTKRATTETLKRAGLTRVRIPLHSGRSDAHDWLVQIPGAARRARKAIQLLAASGLSVEVEVALTRSTASQLAETVQLLSVLGARAVHFRRPVLSNLGSQAVAISPRIGLLQPYLTEAVLRARGLGLGVQLHDLPRCASPEGFRAIGATRPQDWCIPSSIDWQPTPISRSTASCTGCVSPCAGAPEDYVALFGGTEFASEVSGPEPLDVLDDSAVVPVPAPRNGWNPSTRVAAATQRARIGPPERAPVSPEQHQLRVLHLPAQASTRTARETLVRAAQDRPSVLHLTGHWLDHPKGLKLLAETRFFLGEVHVTGLIHPMLPLADRAIGKLERLRKIRAVLMAPDAPAHDALTGAAGSFDATLAMIPRLRALGIEVDLVAQTSDSDAIAAYKIAFEENRIPELPHFAEVL